ncbi:DUF4102 domain-containing protein [Rhodobacteraceae bacterium CCMM004]|nr:DUF4102 domain-containing protein [Rhodobacteraceae bacterium CCMM004]
MERQGMSGASCPRTGTSRTQRITDNFVKGLSPDPGKNVVTYDDRLTGFGIRITPRGHKAFILRYRVAGRERRITIGSYPHWTVAAARLRASELKRDADIGIDPLGLREADRNAPTVLDLFDRYCTDHLPKKSVSGQKEDLSLWRRKILPQIGRMKLADLRYADVDAMHRQISRDTPTLANRVIALLRKSCNLAIKWEWIERNPAVGITLNPENKRDRFLTEDELDRLFRALERHPEQTSCDIVRFLIYTGCRCGEAFRARWDQFDDDLRIWTKPAATTKQRKLHRVPVSSAVTQLLSIRRAYGTSEWVFPSHTGAPFVSIKKTWASVSRTALIEDVRLHDLRHTFASLLVSRGVSLPIIGAMLGHTQPQTTARYAHLFDVPLAAAAEAVCDSLGQARTNEDNPKNRLHSSVEAAHSSSSVSKMMTDRSKPRHIKR